MVEEMSQNQEFSLAIREKDLQRTIKFLVQELTVKENFQSLFQIYSWRKNTISGHLPEMKKELILAQLDFSAPPFWIKIRYTKPHA